MKTKPSQPAQSAPAAAPARPVRRDGAQAATNGLPVPVKWPARSGWNQPQPIKIRQTPPWTRPGLTLLPPVPRAVEERKGDDWMKR